MQLTCPTWWNASMSLSVILTTAASNLSVSRHWSPLSRMNAVWCSLHCWKRRFWIWSQMVQGANLTCWSVTKREEWLDSVLLNPVLPIWLGNSLEGAAAAALVCSCRTSCSTSIWLSLSGKLEAIIDRLKFLLKFILKQCLWNNGGNWSEGTCPYICVLCFHESWIIGRFPFMIWYSPVHGNLLVQRLWTFHPLIIEQCNAGLSMIPPTWILNENFPIWRSEGSVICRKCLLILTWPAQFCSVKPKISMLKTENYQRVLGASSSGYSSVGTGQDHRQPPLGRMEWSGMRRAGGILFLFGTHYGVQGHVHMTSANFSAFSRNLPY